MDDIAKYNKERWDALARANVEFSRPFLDLDPASAREMLDPHDLMGDVTGKDVLCLASGGGQQSVAFALLGAKVTVYDLSETQLLRDRQAAAHYGVSVEIVQGDMRDLSVFQDARFDVVWHAFSINFVPDVEPVLREVARVIRPGGLYRIQFANPFVMGVDEGQWDGEAYPLKRPYVDGAEVDFDDAYWQVWHDDGTSQRVEGPREFRHSLGALMNRLIGLGFVILGAWEEVGRDKHAEPGTWNHLKLLAPPWITFWAAYRPEVYADAAFPR